MLGSAYNPEEHWTSPLRSRRGYAPFTAPNDSPLSSFHIDARAGQAMTDFLITMLVKQAENWKFFPPDYHIDVQTTVDDISASFTWNMLNFDMVGSLWHPPTPFTPSFLSRFSLSLNSFGAEGKLLSTALALEIFIQLDRHAC